MRLEIRDLAKTYPNGVRALDRVSLTIPTGMFGLLGPNGAGKSTLMRTLATLQEADAGSARLVGVNGGGDIDVLRDKDAVRRILGYLPQDFGVYPRVSAEDLLDHFARLKGLADATLVSPANGVPPTKARTTLYAPGPGTVAMTPLLTSPAGSNAPVRVVQPFVTVKCFIALFGVFPSRP